MTEDLVDNRLTLRPVIGVYASAVDDNDLHGPAGVRASNITCAPHPAEGTPTNGEWSIGEATLRLRRGEGDLGPASGVEGTFEEEEVAVGRHRIMVSSRALHAAVRGRTAWGDSGDRGAGQLVVWRWDHAHIDQVRVQRDRRWLTAVDAGLVVEGAGIGARFVHQVVGPGVMAVRATDQLARAACVDGSDLLGFARTLASAVELATGRQAEHDTRSGRRGVTDVFRFASA